MIKISEKEKQLTTKYLENEKKLRDSADLINWAKSFDYNWLDKGILLDMKKIGTNLVINGEQEGITILKELGIALGFINSIVDESNRLIEQNKNINKQFEKQDEPTTNTNSLID